MLYCSCCTLADASSRIIARSCAGSEGTAWSSNFSKMWKLYLTSGTDIHVIWMSHIMPMYRISFSWRNMFATGRSCRGCFHCLGQYFAADVLDTTKENLNNRILQGYSLQGDPHFLSKRNRQLFWVSRSCMSRTYTGKRKHKTWTHRRRHAIGVAAIKRRPGLLRGGCSAPNTEGWEGRAGALRLDLHVCALRPAD